MRPLAIMTTYNRLELTVESLGSLVKKTDMADLEIHVVDNGSSDGTPHWLAEWKRRRPNVTVTLLPVNIGCPRALNLALRDRQPGQHLVKMDNDVRIETENWLPRMLLFLKDCEEAGAFVGMAAPAYEEMGRYERVLSEQTFVGASNTEWAVRWMNFIPGHLVLYTSTLMGLAGFFDVLGDDHLYGFEDNIMCHKANVLRMRLAGVGNVRCTMLQRASALGGEAREEHVAHFRPMYRQRVQALVEQGGNLFTGPDGQPEA